MNDVSEGLDYARMLEIPVSTVNVVKRKSLFPHRQKREDDLKEKVVESVNNNSASGDGAENEAAADGFVRAEDLSFRPAKSKKMTAAGTVILCEGVAACLLAAGIFLTNVFIADTAINAFVGSLTAVAEEEAAYTDFTLASPVSLTSDAEVSVSDEGAISFTGKTAVYPVADGEISSVTLSDGLYTVKITHTSTFCSVVTGVDAVYCSVGDEVKSNLPFACSNGENEVKISMYDGETQLNSYTISGATPVWNS